MAEGQEGRAALRYRSAELAVAGVFFALGLFAAALAMSGFYFGARARSSASAEKCSSSIGAW